MTNDEREREATVADAAPPAGLRRFAPLLLTVLAGLLAYGLFYNRGAWLSVIGYSVSPAERVLQGEVPYRDFLYNYTPGILWLNACLMRLFGVGLLPIHIGLLAFKLATLILLFITGKKLVGNWAALVPVALSLSWIGYKYIFGVFPTQYSMPFILLGIFCMLRHEEGEKPLWLFLSGASVGVVFLFKYNVGILLCGCGGLAVALRYLAVPGAPASRRLLATLKPVLIFALGFAVAVLPLFFYLLANGALAAMVDHFLHHVAAYSGERKVPLPSLKQLLPVTLGIVVVALGAWLIVRRAPGLFRAYLLVVFLLAAVALLIPERAYVIKISALAFVAYLPLLLFAGVAAFCMKKSGVWSRIRGQGTGDRGQETGQQPDAAAHQEFQYAEPQLEPLASVTSSRLTPHPPRPAPFTSSPLHRRWRRYGSLIIVTLFALGAYLEIYPRADTYHVVRALPPTFLLLALLLARALPTLCGWLARLAGEGDGAGREGVASRESGACRAWRREAQMVAALPLALLMLVGVSNTWLPNFDARSRFKDRAPLAIERGQGIYVPPKQAEFIEELTALIQANSAPNEPIFSFGQRGAGFYFLAGRKNPTRFVWWRNVGVRREDREAVLRLVGEREAKLILLQDALQDRRIREIVTANYHVIGWSNGIAVYDRNP